MKKELIGIIVCMLLVVVSIYPAVAIDLNTSCDSSTIISKNDNLNDVPVNEMTTYEEIYENKNCLVSIKASNSFMYTGGIFAGIIAIIYMLTGFIIGNLYFGYFYPNTYYPFPADGWIHTKGSMGEWTYEGKFWGQLYVEHRPPYFTGYCIGVKGCIGRYSRVLGYFIGFANHVKIGPKQPEPVG